MGFAAGNKNRPVNGIVNETGWPNNQPSGLTQWLAGIAAHEDVIAVAASSSLATKSAYSNWGREISVCAPSNNVRPRTFPRGIVTTDRVGPSGYSSIDYTRDFGGTSSACPTVAGVAALILFAYPNLTALDVRDLLQTTADKIVDNSIDPQLGNQFGSYDAAGHSQWFGFGRVNAFQALIEAQKRLQVVTGQMISKSSAPALVIPYNDVTGIRNIISFEENVNLTSIRVIVVIDHTYIGDLRLTLIAPLGQQVLLHDRNGGRTSGLKKTFDVANAPGLIGLVEESVQGDWTLFIQDLAIADTGLLNRWELEIAGRQDNAIRLEEMPGVAIPDNSSGRFERTLTAPGDGRIHDIVVSLDITHTYIVDLNITLISPSGISIVLHDRSGGREDNIIKTYTSVTTPGISALRGQPVLGTWR